MDKELRPFTIQSKCVADDAELFRNIEHALTLGLDEVPQFLPHDGLAVMVGSGPSLSGQLDAIHQYSLTEGAQIIALKDAHDWLLDFGIVPDYAVAIDPQASRSTVFVPDHRVKYLMASQCHADLFARLNGYDVRLWHCYVRQGQIIPPPGTPLIAGGTTTGLRAITLLYTMGFRRFELFGYDSCLQDGRLRMNGDTPRSGDDVVNEIVVNDKLFYCNPSMTAQATEFQNLFQTMPDIEIHVHGDGLIAEIMKVRETRPLRTVAFLHHYGPNSASFRYRAAMPSEELGAGLNDLSADVLVVGKPDALTLPEMKQALGKGQSVIVDFCDDHFDQPHYRDMLRLADAVTCSTDVLAKKIATFGREATVIPEPYRLPELPPHFNGPELLWFGHPTNGKGLETILPLAFVYPLTVITKEGAVQGAQHVRLLTWSEETVALELSCADIVLMPKTDDYKSANRTVEAIRSGCFVVAEPHPSLTKIPGIWIGDIQEGITWALQHPQQANERIRQSQIYVSQVYAPRIVASAWSRVIQACPSTWGQVIAPGPLGSMLMAQPEPKSSATSDSSRLVMATPTG